MDFFPALWYLSPVATFLSKKSFRRGRDAGPG